MKKIIFIFLFSFHFVSEAQFVRGFGLFVSGTSSRHSYINSNLVDSTNIHALPESHNSAERISWGAGVTMEMLPFEIFRWRTEIGYVNKGAKEDELINPFTDEHRKGVNKFGNLGWNNFLIFRMDQFNWIGYGLIGARLEYNLSKSTPAYQYVAGEFKKLFVSPDIGIGFELNPYGRFKPHLEIHYNPDIRKQFDKGNVTANNRTWEVRLGVTYRKKKNLDIDCNAPRYRDNY
jgi:hypothetical protein